MNDQQSSGLVARVRGLLASNKDLLLNAASLAAGTGLTSLFGFVFNKVAQDEFGPAAYGDATAAITAMQLFAVIGMFGLGTMLIGELPRMKSGRGSLFSAAMGVSFIGSAVLGLVFALVVGVFLRHRFHGIGGDLNQVLLFVFGTAITASTLVFDEGIIGMLRGGIQLGRNLVMSAVKLALLPVTLVALHDKIGLGITTAFVLGTVVSVAPVIFIFARDRMSVFHRPDWGRMRELFPVALSHNWLNLATQVPTRIVPIVVVGTVGNTLGGVFYVVSMIAALLFMVPVQLGTVLFALASASPDVVAEKLRFVLRVSTLVGIPVMLVLAVGAKLILGLINPVDAEFGTIPLILYIVGYIPQMPAAQYIAVSRATGKVNQAALLLVGFGVLEVAAIAAGGILDPHSLLGLSVANLAVLTIQGIVTAPTVFRAAAVKTVEATGAFQALDPLQQTSMDMRRLSGPLSRVTGELSKLATGAMPVIPGSAGRQQSGLAALFAIASAAVASDTGTMNVATQIWRTGAFPSVPQAAAAPRRAAPAAVGAVAGGHTNPATSLDMFSHMAAKPDPRGNQGAPTRPQGEPTRVTPLPPLPVPPAGGLPGQPAGRPAPQVNYRHRQQAGIDALLAIATPVVQDDRQEAEARRLPSLPQGQQPERQTPSGGKSPPRGAVGFMSRYRMLGSHL
jgi:O-antigen/teichoic acid export membrane protein